MEAQNLKRLVSSHIENLDQVVTTLKEQGHDIKLTRAGDCIFLTHVKPGQVINEAFYLDNIEALSRLRNFTVNLRTQIVVPSIEQGSSSFQGVAHG